MIKLPPALEKITSALAPAFTKPAHARVCVLLTAAILTVGSRTISSILRTAGRLVPSHCSTCHRILSGAKFWHWRVGRILAKLVVEAFCPEGLIDLATIPSLNIVGQRSMARAAIGMRFGPRIH